ncbi:MAG: hypothetical protein ABIQ93_04625, partial [Saprospiraceae bacterium]
EQQQAFFDRSIEQFEQGEPLAAYRTFFEYLKNAPGDNINWHDEADTLHFEFWQGSQRIVGLANAEKVRVESKLVQADDLNVGFLRRLMEYNFNLKFSRFALSPENSLAIRFDTYTSDGSPLKLLHALRELAIHADKQDDLLLDEFRNLRPVETAGFGDLPLAEKERKYQYIRRDIEQVFALLDQGKPDPNQYPGTYAYLLLALAFRLDYLVKPEGFMMDTMERVHTIYFSKNERTPQMKVTAIRKEFQKLLDRPQDDFFREMYRTRSTFGINPAVNHDAIANLIQGEMPNMDWPLQQNYPELALAVPQYIAGFALFHYAPPKPDRELLHLFFQISEARFFKELGFQKAYADEAGRLYKSEILKEIKNITERNRMAFPRFRPDVNRLDFASMTLFAKSLLLMIKDLDLTAAG